MQQCTVSLDNARVFCAVRNNRISLFYCSGSIKYWNGFNRSDVQCAPQDVNVSALKRPCLSLWPNEVVILKIKVLASNH